MFTLFTTAWSVLGIRKLMSGGGNGNDAGVGVTSMTAVEPIVAVGSGKATTPNKKPFGKTLFRTLKAFAWITGLSSVRLMKDSPMSSYVNPLRSSFLLFITLSTFVFGSNLPKSFTRTVHPLVTCTCLTWLSVRAFAALTGSTFIDVLKLYKTGSLSPLSAGPGDVLLFLLGPAVVALSCQMYGRRKLMRENVPEVAASTIASSIGGLYGTAALVRMLRISDHTVRLSLLSRNITSPLAMAIASMLGANASLAVTMVVVTGLFGANFGASILDAVGIRDGVARGLGIGAAAHGLGTAAFANEEDAFPFAAISMALTASACTVLVSLPLVRKSILRLALGAR
jgi:putative effector of murein hydrolase